MAKKLYAVRHPETGETKEFDWQNALELHNLHGWEFVKPQAEERKAAVEEASAEEEEVETSDEVDEDDETPAEEDASEEDGPADETVDLENMSKDELQAEATKRGIEFDKRWGSKSLIEAIAAAQEAGE